ncbi:MAG: HEAT repeat domain-containing protein [Spirochaetales bacterium]|nr:HEAT repeat domain-containing protein [Spirochaetales bacterium]
MAERERRYCMMRALVFVTLIFAATIALSADEPVPAQTSAEIAAKEIKRRTDTILYGIESQVIELLSTLRAEKNEDYNESLLSAFDSSTSPKLKVALFEFFAESSFKNAEKRALVIIRDRDEQDDSLVGAAFSYLLAITSDAALQEATQILQGDEKKYTQAAIAMIGAAGSEKHAETLREVYEKPGIDQASKEAIVRALGSLRSTESFDLLSSIAGSDESTKAIRMYACQALGEIQDPRAVDVLVKASHAADPNVRASALASLGSYKTPAALAAVREGLRDAHVLARIAAAKATGAAADVESIPALEYKVVYDPEKAVRQASIEALATIGGAGVFDFLVEYFSNTKNPAVYRSLAFGAVVRQGNDKSRKKALEGFAAAQVEKDRSLYTAYAKAISGIDQAGAHDFIAVMFADKEFSIRLGAIAWVERNKDASFESTLRSLSENDPIDAVKRRAALALERLSS